MTTYYHLGDTIPNVPIYAQSSYRGKLTGEFRPPKKGEWYLSGAIPTAYLASNDLTTSFNILKIVKVKRVEYLEEVSF